jgi:predicted nucleic acid-binding protein
MVGPTERLLIDSGILVKWQLTSEEYASEAQELLEDWRHRVTKVCVPIHVFTEVMSAFLKAQRRGRLSEQEALDGVNILLGFPVTFYKVTGRIITRALQIATQENQRGYDCVYVALAERKGMDFWTADERLFNAVRLRYPFVRWIADYIRKRP